MTGKLLSTAGAALLAASVAGCGFKPMYAPTSLTANGGENAVSVLGPVVVDTVEGKAGHELKTALDRRFSVERGRGAPSRLVIQLTETVAGLGYRVDDSASRSDLILQASYRLLDPAGALRVEGATSQIASYDIPASAYGDISAQNAARARAAEALADQIRLQIAAKLAREAARASAAPATP